MAGELGFEPRLTESESAVLPLNYSPPIPLYAQRHIGTVLQIMGDGLANTARRALDLGQQLFAV
jgi:hypothetical protein